MATRKQRQRRAKTFRHETYLASYDEEGNEIEVKASELRAKKDKPDKAKSTASASSGKGRTTRATRAPSPPSWRRSLRRGGLWGSATVVASVLLLRSASVPARIVIGVFYAALFIPMTYWLDGMVYRKYLKRQGGGDLPRSSGKTR